MAQHDYNIANQTGLEFRADLNNALQAIVTENSGATAPATTFPGMVWRDTSSSPSVLKKRNDANDAWITVLTPAGEAISGAADASSQRTALGLGTSATFNVGTAANNIVQLNGAAKLPAVDGSLLTNLPATGLVAATTGEAQAGTSNTVAITPLRLREGLNASGSAPIYACRAWANFNGTGTPTLRGSGNVLGITDNGVGDYTVTFSTAIQDTNYAAPCSAGRTSAVAETICSPYAFTTTSVSLSSNDNASALVDSDYVSVAIFR